MTHVWFSPFGLKKYAAELAATTTMRPIKIDHLHTTRQHFHPKKVGWIPPFAKRLVWAKDLCVVEELLLHGMVDSRRSLRG